MTKPRGASNGPDKALKILDDLIERTYKRFLKSEEIEKIKLGELLKMIEQRQKLTPNDLSQKQFWSKLEKIRKEALGETKLPARSANGKAAVGRTTRKSRRKSR